MSGGIADPQTPPPIKVEPGAWLAVIAGALGSFMATLDISIVNAALPTIQGEIGATATEATWIATAYLVAEIIIIPLSGWLSRLFGLRSFLLGATLGFTGFSMLCGLSDSLGLMVFARAGQGLTGGAMIPTAMTIIATRLPPARQPIGNAIFGMTAILGPVLGPLVGGLMTEYLSWHYAFFINLPIGMVLLFLLFTALRHERAQLDRLEEADWLGVAGLTLALGGLTLVLEEGQREQWFESSLIRWLSVASLLGLILLLLGQKYAARPVIRLSLLRDRAFGAVAAMGVLMGMVLYGTSYMIPQFLAALADYTAFQSGSIVLIAGLPSLIMMPMAPLLFRLFDARVAVFTGMMIMAASCWLESGLTADAVGADFVLSQIMRGVGQVLAILFLNQAAMGAVARDLAADAAGLFNAARNIGGSLALAGIAMLQDQRMWLHSRHLEQTLSANAPATGDYISQLGSGNLAMGMRLLAGIIRQQASVMTFNDLFWLLGTGAGAVSLLAFILRPHRPPPRLLDQA
ncbi:MDR family MFS transporter [Niveispirillum irakense]|uniref:MDR family MFS transporter n=1 Tax=Niveispirillum irakense TaxID=34011 RepID=UPI0003FDA6E0|nr:MDR family MFS transporter [Niveispirillum irakense]